MRPLLRLLGALLVLHSPAGIAIAQEAPTGSAAEAAGRLAGEAAADEVPRAEWFGRGFLGGLVAGPIGGVVVVTRAGRSEPVLPPTAGTRLSGRNAPYVEGFTNAYAQRIREERREAALVGSIVGTGVLAAVLLYVMDFHLTGEAHRGPGIPEEPGRALHPGSARP